jgi:hypothetical protein
VVEIQFFFKGLDLPSNSLPIIDAIASIIGNGNMSCFWFQTRAAPGSGAE